MPELTMELLDKLRQWKRAGCRGIKLEQEQNSDKWYIWIYDYTLRSGLIVDVKCVNEDWDKLILTGKRSVLETELREINERLGVA